MKISLIIIVALSYLGYTFSIEDPITTLTRSTKNKTGSGQNLPHNCDEAVNQTGRYDLHKIQCGAHIFTVICLKGGDMDPDIHNPNHIEQWLVIQRRMDGNEHFNRNWVQYKEGFGDIDSDFWIGLDMIKRWLKYRKTKLWIKLKDFNGVERSGIYTDFDIGDENEKYELKSVGNFVTKFDNFKDSLTEKHLNQKFSTWDSDNDNKETNCADVYNGGWWFNKCHDSHLNGQYLFGAMSHFNPETNKSNSGHGIHWKNWRGRYYSYRYAHMAIKPDKLDLRPFNEYYSGAPIFYSPAPRGTCINCCEIREREDFGFLLYTRKNPYKPYNLYLGDDRRLSKSNFDFNKPLAIYLHGFSETATADNQSSQQIKDSFLRASNYNVILIDWSPITAAPWYANAVENLPVAARFIARFIRYLIGRGYSAKQIHLIGFSLGAEVAGFVGKQLQEWGVVLPRITGLDPALPLFERESSNRRLGPADARFVDIIHTDGGILGNPDAMGHADFYPNGGRPLQPGCARQEIANNRWIGILIGCSHQRAWEYFIESVKWPQAFPVNRCEPSKTFALCKDGNGRAFMGMGADRRLRGKFFLDTNDVAPYGRRTSAALVVQTQQANNATVVTTGAETIPTR